MMGGNKASGAALLVVLAVLGLLLRGRHRLTQGGEVLQVFGVAVAELSRARNILPNVPSKNGEVLVDISPRVDVACLSRISKPSSSVGQRIPSLLRTHFVTYPSSNSDPLLHGCPAS